MPVGSSDQGIGLWGGQVMLTIDNMSAHFDWEHDQIDENEPFDQKGDLVSFTLSPTLSIGLNDYWMLSLTQQLGYRGMGWHVNADSKHHRTENSTTDFLNAIGGVLGDTHIKLRYLLLNTGSMEGYRFFLGLGLIKPSKNTLTSDPFFLDESEVEDHRHFSISEGSQKSIYEIQIFKKQIKNPIFYGITLKTILPLETNEYGFRPSKYYEFAFTMLSSKINSINGSLGFNFNLLRTSESYWNDIKTPNSKSEMVLFGIGYTRNIAKGSIILGIQKPYFLKVTLSSTNEGDFKQKINAIQVTIGYRQILDLSIPFLE